MAGRTFRGEENAGIRKVLEVIEQHGPDNPLIIYDAVYEFSKFNTKWKQFYKDLLEVEERILERQKLRQRKEKLNDYNVKEMSYFDILKKHKTTSIPDDKMDLY